MAVMKYFRSGVASRRSGVHFFRATSYSSVIGQEDRPAKAKSIVDICDPYMLIFI